MAELSCATLAERFLIPAFVYFFQMLYPFSWVAQRDRATAAAAGGCTLVRRTALEGAGGIAAIRSEIIDDCALARRLKGQGPIWLGLTRRATSLRPYGGFRKIGHMAMDRAQRQSGAGQAYDEAIARGVEWIKGLQSGNGGWAAFDADNVDNYLNNIPFADHAALGFSEVGRATIHNGSKTVRYLRCCV